LDTLLRIRINLHEDLPRHLRHWNVRDGRATFTVPGEFEFDVTVTDEDPASAYDFIDLRFLFKPSPSIPDGRFRMALHDKLSGILRASGLSGCYDFLHNFCLTQKLLALQRQANELVRTAWSGALLVDLMRRVLIIQYWTSINGQKSWIEIGITSGFEGVKSWRGPEPPALSIRWIRNGKEVKDHQISVDWKTLDFKGILQSVVSLHISDIFNDIERNIQALGQPHSTITSTIQNPPDDVSAHRLEITLGKPTNKVDVLVDRITGRLVLRPATLLAANIEDEINKQPKPADEAHRGIVRLLCKKLRLQIERQADICGWELIRPAISDEDIRRAFGQDVRLTSFFRCRGWRSPWSLVVCIDLAGESWWLARVESGSKGDQITFSKNCPIQHLDGVHSISQSFMRRLEKEAIEELALYQCSAQLQRLDVRHSAAIENSPLMKQSQTKKNDDVSQANAETVSATPSELAMLQRPKRLIAINMADLLTRAIPQLKKAPKWASDILRLYFRSFDVKHGRVIYLARSEMKTKGNVRQTKINISGRDGVSIGEDGSFSFSMSAEFGTDCMDQLTGRLRSLTRLIQFHNDLPESWSRKCTLSSIQFQIPKSHQTIEVAFPENKRSELHFHPDSPYQRIRSFLNDLLNSASMQSFQSVIRHLLVVRPLLGALDHIEQPTTDTAFSGFPPPLVHPRTITWYTIVYSAPNPECSFELQLKSNRNDLTWAVTDPWISQKPESRATRPSDLADKLGDLYKGTHDHWKGIRSGIAANWNTGIRDAVIALDETVKSCRKEEDLKRLQQSLESLDGFTNGERDVRPTRPTTLTNATTEPQQARRPGSGPPGQHFSVGRPAQAPNARQMQQKQAQKKGRAEVITLE
jgi:mediator of RNA polymerase II transcription subunit 14